MPCDQVSPMLLLGSQEDVSEAWMKGAKAFLSLGSEVDLPLPREDLLRLELLDVEDANLLECLPRCCEFIQSRMEQEKMVMVHCVAGVSRSSAVVIAYLMRVEDISLEQALARVREARPQACPNDGFMRQLDLFRSMGCVLDKENSSYRAHCAAQLARNRALVAQTMLRDPQVEGADNEAYRCKVCRKTVADIKSVLVHEIGSGSGAFHWKKRNKDLRRPTGETVGVRCSSLFVEPLSWMEGAMESEVKGKIHCPSCRARLGSFDWSGAQCNCGAWVSPAFQLLRSKLDEPSGKMDFGKRSPSLSPNFCHLIFDCDGVLVDSEPLSCEALRLAVKQVTGFDPPHRFPEDFVPLFGMDIRATVKYYRKKFCNTDPRWSDEEKLSAELSEAKDLIYAKIAEQRGIQCFEGVRELVLQARSLGMTIAVGSSGSPAKIKMNLEKAGIYHLFDPDCIVSAKTVPHGKPAPDVYLEAMRRVRCKDPSKAIVIEDAVLGLKSGRAAGAFTVGVSTSLPQEDLLPHADVVYGSLMQVDLQKLR